MARCGILILHGFTGHPFDAQELGDVLAREFSAEVVIPTLPGHATHADDLFDVSWKDWLDAALAAYDTLAARVDKVAIVGISFGGALMFALARERNPVALVSLATPVRLRYHPFIRVALPFVRLWNRYYYHRSFPGQGMRLGYDPRRYEYIPLSALAEMMQFLERTLTPALLRKVTAPVLVVSSPTDRVIAPWSARYLARFLGGEVIMLDWETNRHLLIQGTGKEALAKEICQFLRPIFSKN